MKNNLLIAQSGGPTTAINATLSGILKLASISNKVDSVYAAKNGIEGVLNEQFINVEDLIQDVDALNKLSLTPGAALGSCRYKLKDISEDCKEYKKIINILIKHEISYFIYIGGNDSMDTVAKLSQYCEENNIKDIKIIGAPKTIDNDLEEIDHAPGFGSAAKYIGTTFAELERDILAYESKSVTIVEVMGRNTGWLTAASALSRLNGNVGPSLIYLCEKVFYENKFIEDVKEKLKKQNAIIVAVSEGVKTKDGNYLCSKNEIKNQASDMFGHSYIAGVGKYLEQVVKTEIGCKVRSIELSLMQRCAMQTASATDITESTMLGMKSLQLALEGKTGQMASLKRGDGERYKVEYISVPIEKVANKEKKVPIDWINQNGNDIKIDLLNYLFPLIQGEINLTYSNGIPQQYKFVNIQ
ncbi:MAG: 6-phosphofructokinase [Clostridium botulinum]|nr:6-phosphofructokinase [Clostridium botulinum]